MNEKQDHVVRDWMKLLQPEVLRQNLLLASLYLSAYEILRSSIINRIENFFTLGTVDDKGKPIIDKQYEEVKRLHKNVLQASCLWLQENGALSVDDVAEVDAIRQHRNQVAHELPKFLVEASYEINIEYLSGMQRLLEKIEIWWIRNFDLATNPDFIGVEIADEDIQPGPVILLQWITQAALDIQNK